MQAELKAGGRRGRRTLLGVCREAAALGAAGSRAAELEPALVLGLEAADAKTRQLGFEPRVQVARRVSSSNWVIRIWIIL